MKIPDIFKNISKNIDKILAKNLVKNLVFKGGGVRGIAYMGALEVLEEIGLLKNIKRIAGTSAGAIAALAVCFNLNMKDTITLFNTLNLSEVPQSLNKNIKMKFWQSKDSECTRRFFQKYGWYSSEYFHEWLEEIIAAHCDGNGRATFEDFHQQGFRDLYIVASNLSQERSEVFSRETTPQVSVADAVRMSMSIPIFFEALQFDGENFGAGDFYLDGGLFDNYPMHIFDDEKIGKDSWLYRDGINWETIGLFLIPEQREERKKVERPKDVWEFLNLTILNVYTSQQTASYKTNPVDKYRTIEINDMGISPVEFDIMPGSQEYNLLYQSGRDAAKKFFEPKKIAI